MIAAPPAAAQLLNVLTRPEVLRALTAMVMGPAGNPNARAGGTEVPVAAIANLIGSLAQQAAEEYRVATNGAGEELPDYLADDVGNLRCDPTSSEERAAVLYELLLSDPTPRESLEPVSDRFGETDWDDDAYEWEETDTAAFYDDVEIGELLASEALE